MRYAEEKATKENDTPWTILLTTFTVKAKELRAEFYSYSNQLPAPLAGTMKQHFKERIRVSKGRPMLGEAATFLFGDLLNVPAAVVNHLAFSWLLLYEHCLLVDDLVDRRRVNRIEETLLSQMLLAGSLQQYHAILGKDDALWQAFDRYYCEWVEGMMSEREWALNGGMPERSIAVRMQGQKAAIVKFCVAAMLHADRGRLLTGSEERGVDRICTAVQLLDDLADIWDDHVEGRLNTLLHEAYLANGAKGKAVESVRERLGYEELAILLLQAGALQESWSEAAACIHSGMSDLGAVDCATRSALNALSKECSRFAMLSALPAGSHVTLESDNLEGEFHLARKKGAFFAAEWLLKHGPKAAQ
jgi:hypothetical protein